VHVCERECDYECLSVSSSVSVIVCVCECVSVFVCVFVWRPVETRCRIGECERQRQDAGGVGLVACALLQGVCTATRVL